MKGESIMENRKPVIQILESETSGRLLGKALRCLIKEHSHAFISLADESGKEETYELTRKEFEDIASNAAYLNLGYADIPQDTNKDMILLVWYKDNYRMIYRHQMLKNALVNISLCEEIISSLALKAA